MVRKPVVQVKTATASAEYQCAKIVIRKTKIASRLNEHLTLVFFFFFFCLKWIIRWYSCWSFCSGLVSKENYSEFLSRSNVKLDRFTDLFLAVVSLPTLGYVVRVSFTFKSYVFWEKKFFFLFFTGSTSFRDLRRFFRGTIRRLGFF